MQAIAVCHREQSRDSFSPIPTVLRSVRRSEWMIVSFLAYGVVMAWILPIAPPLRLRIFLWNFLISAVYVLLVRADSTRPRLTTSVIRDWLPLALVLFAYREVGWFALPQPSHELETHLVVWDKIFLHGGATAMIESFGTIVPSLLEISYTLVYALAPFSLAFLYSIGGRKGADRFLFIFVTAVLLCYVQFPFFPSEPPRTIFPGEDLPSHLTIFRRFNLWTLAGYGIHTGVFPSAHVAGAFATAFGLRRASPGSRWAFLLLTIVATLIALATVYGRYHYLADAVAGVCVATLALGFSRLLDRTEPTDRAAGR